MSEWVGWHFLPQDRCLRYGNRELVEVGQTLTTDADPVLCEAGFHASRRALDALRYAPGPVVCRVTLGGVIVEGEDKAAGQNRTVLAMAGASDLLHEFACWCAERVLPLFEQRHGDDPRPRQAVAAKRQWLRGEISDEQLDAAWDAAWAAARAAARGAAWGAAWEAARAAAWDEQNAELETRLLALLGL